jgi:AbiV family abortive infection protein
MTKTDSSDALGMQELLEIFERLDAEADTDPRALSWIRVLRASVRNGNDLLNEARLLHETCGSPRAFALAVLAHEEFGKAIKAFVVLNSGGEPTEVADFERTYRLHQLKLEAGELWSSLLYGDATPGDALAQQVRAAAGAAAGRKMDAFYVDRRPDGSVSEPRAVLNSGDVQVALDAAASLGGSVTRVAALLDSDHVVNLFWRLGPHINGRLAEVLVAQPDLVGQFLDGVRELLPTLGLALDDFSN